jgi:DNA-directed RNA polymerase specialized sigma24 family protein
MEFLSLNVNCTSLSTDGNENGRSELAASHNAPFGDHELNATLQRCLKRICCWQPPPNWSTRAWFQEITAHGICAVCQAQRDFDPSRGVPLGAFVYQRVLARAFTRYRQEWTYACRHAPDSESGESDETRHFDGAMVAPEPTPCCHADLHCALASLPDIDRSIIEQIFWHERTETDLAKTMHISQQAVNKRKRLALVKLGNTLYESDKSSRARL